MKTRGAIRMAILAACLLTSSAWSQGGGANVIATWGTYGTGDGQFNYPYGIAISTLGDLYVSDQYNYRIERYTTSGQFVSKWGSQGHGPGQFFGTIGMGLDAAGQLYVADCGNDRVQVFDRDGAFLRQWSLYRARDVAVAPDGLVHVVSVQNPWVDVFTPAGSFVRRYGGQFSSATSIVIDASGVAVICDENATALLAPVVTVWSPGGTLLRSWGKPGASFGFFNGPAGVGLDRDGRVYIAEHMANRVQVFSSTGQWLAAWGGTGSAPGSFDHAVDIALDDSGFIYVVDMHNHRIQKFAYVPAATARVTWAAVKARFR